MGLGIDPVLKPKDLAGERYQCSIKRTQYVSNIIQSAMAAEMFSVRVHLLYCTVQPVQC